VPGPQPIFTAASLDDPALHRPGPRPVEVCSFEQEAMKSPAGEESLLVARAPKLAYDGPVAFYRAACELAGTDLGAECRPIDERTALARVNAKIASLREPIPFELRSRFVAAMAMASAWDFDTTLIETERDYVVVSWQTTA
jgi:hypothetical protein